VAVGDGNPMTARRPHLDRAGAPGDALRGARIRLLSVPGCPLVDSVRGILERSLAERQLHLVVEEVEGPYPSPTLLIDGLDVTGRTPDTAPSCRLDLPTEEQVLVALSRLADVP
jgi:hypothetical protein